MRITLCLQMNVFKEMVLHVSLNMNDSWSSASRKYVEDTSRSPPDVMGGLMPVSILELGQVYG